ncbi:hypothetical protein GUJ93_ZPchr0002g23928 [Zizania palustris]|uniref:Cysteine protease n=1 Tax=Zizania palustris TaxID=103762 RepID=A0A8J5VVC2_ZIZPA|nr:hypothetical protein GUJ93_ZPchr0002g23928 [Zizania palustris]
MDMRKPIIVGVLAVLVAAMAVAAVHEVYDDDVLFTEKDLESEESMWNLYERWNDVYTSSSPNLAEKVRRFEAFKENARYVNEFNKDESMTYKLGLNKFADLTLDEFVAKYTGAKLDSGVPLISSVVPEEEELLVGVVPTAWDWRNHGGVTAVKDQGSCGSCWAFSAVGAAEGANAIATKKLVTLSEQQVLDCSGAGDCNGGWPYKVYEVFAIKQGIALNQSYPAYDATKHACRTVAGKTPVVKMDGWARVPAGEANLKQIVYKQPVSVIIDASTSSFQLYKSGVYNGPCGLSTNHAVLAVGYGQTNAGVHYWIVKNSWGANWGDRGYILMRRDIAAKEGICGIAVNGVYPTKK